MYRTLLLLVGLALGLQALAPAASAQGATTASIEGTISDASGLGLPGATVIAVHTPSGTEYGAATRADGRFDLRGLRVGGPYTVRATFIGFQTVERTGIQLTLGEAQTVNFELAEASEELGEVEVVAQSDADIARSRTGAQTNVSEEDIEALPTIGRSLSDFARLSPLASGGGSSSIAGRNNRYNNIQIDGATLNDVFGLAGNGTPGGQTGTQPISLDAIEEFNVQVAPYDVRASGFTGGQINAVTKSGTNEFTGTLRLLGRNDALVGDFRNEDGTVTQFGEFSEGLIVGTFGGPIIRDKLFFFVSGELFRNEFPDNTGVAGSGAPNEFLLDGPTVQNIVDIAQNQYGYTAGTFDVISDNRASDKLLVKLDWNISGNHRLTVRNNFVNASDDQGIGRGRTSFDLSARRYQFASTQNSFTTQLNSTFGNNMVNEARFVYTAVRDSRDVVDQPFPDTDIQVTDDARISLGIDRFSQANALDQDLFEITNNFTLFAGDHTITLGTQNEIFGFDNLFIQDFYGNYEFAPLSGNVFVDTDGDGIAESNSIDAVTAFRLGLPSEYRFSYASAYQFDAAGNLQFDANGNPVRTINAGERPQAAFTSFQLGLYAQDEWDVTDNFRVTAGVRVDVPFFPEEPVNNPLVSGGTGVRPDGSTFQIQPAFSAAAYQAFSGADYDGSDFADITTTNTSSGNPLFSPRLGFNYQRPGLMGRTLQVRGGTGIFSGRTPYVFISNQYSNTGADLARLDARFSLDDFDTNGNGIIDPSEMGFFTGSADPANQPVPGQNAVLQPVQTTEINLIDPDFKFPQVWRTNIGIDQELPLGFVATLEGIYSGAINDVVFRNLNLGRTGSRFGLPTAESAYGRPLYNRGVNGNFTNALLITNTDEGYSYSLYGQLKRSVREGFGGSFSYTYNRAENVNNATSSRAISNFQFNENVDVNNPELGTADFEVRHRILGYLTYRQQYLDRFSTQIGLVLDTQAGEPFSWIYNGDANGDLQRFNDLIFVPAQETDVFLTSDNWSLLNAFIEGEPGLDEHRGDFVARNSSRAPWQTRLDLEISQGVETIRGQRLDFEFTLINLLNLLDPNWGRIRFTSFNNVTALSHQGYVDPGDVGTTLAGRVVTQDDIGKPIVSFSERLVEDSLDESLFGTADLGSRWQFRLGVKYTF